MPIPLARESELAPLPLVLGVRKLGEDHLDQALRGFAQFLAQVRQVLVDDRVLGHASGLSESPDARRASPGRFSFRVRLSHKPPARPLDRFYGWVSKSAIASVTRAASVPRSLGPAALVAISAIAQQLFRDGFMRQPRVKAKARRRAPTARAVAAIVEVTR